MNHKKPHISVQKDIFCGAKDGRTHRKTRQTAEPLIINMFRLDRTNMAKRQHGTPK